MARLFLLAPGGPPNYLLDAAVAGFLINYLLLISEERLFTPQPLVPRRQDFSLIPPAPVGLSIRPGPNIQRICDRQGVYRQRRGDLYYVYVYLVPQPDEIPNEVVGDSPMQKRIVRLAFTMRATGAVRATSHRRYHGWNQRVANAR